MTNLCPHCFRPQATEEDWEIIPEGQGEHLCWSEGMDCDREPLFNLAGLIVENNRLKEELARFRNR